MVNLKNLCAILIAVALVVGGFLWLRPSEERRIRRVFERMAERLEKSPQESVLESGFRAKAVAESFADGVLLKSDEPSFSYTANRADVSAAVLALRRGARKLKVSFESFEIDVSGSEASVACDLLVQDGGGVLGLGSERDVRHLDLRMEKDAESGEWIVREAESSRVVVR